MCFQIVTISKNLLIYLLKDIRVQVGPHGSKPCCSRVNYILQPSPSFSLNSIFFYTFSEQWFSVSLEAGPFENFVDFEKLGSIPPNREVDIPDRCT